MTTPEWYRVSQSAAVDEQLRGIIAQARAEGRLRALTAALKWVKEELERTPDEFGESREYYAAAALAARIGFARPLAVGFGVHEPSRTVFVRRFGLLPG